MNRWALLLAFAASLGSAAELYRPVRDAGRELLQNGGLESTLPAERAAWQAWGGGFTPAPGEGRGGGLAVRVQRTADGDPERGAVQAVTPAQPLVGTFTVEAWSRAEGVSGGADGDYSLYVDLTATDGSMLWGGAQPFEPATHGWQRRILTITPAKPIRTVKVFGLFRKHTGTAWFDDFSLRVPDSAGGTIPLDGRPFAPQAVPAGGAPQITSAGPLTIDWAGTRLRRLSLGGRDVTGTAPGGLMVRDVAAESGFHEFVDGRCEALGLTIETRFTADADHVQVDGVLTDTTGRDRAVTLLLALPLAGSEWRWADDLDTQQPVTPAADRHRWNDLGCGANGMQSSYPLANVAGPAGGLNLGVDLTMPGQYRLGCAGGVLYAAFDFALTSQARRFPGRAPFRVVLYPSDAAWGMRAGWQGYYRLFPESFRVRIPDQGLWMPFASIKQVEGWEDFGFRFHEAPDDPAWDAAHGILAFRYALEVGTFWAPYPAGEPRTPEALSAWLARMAADPKAPRRRWYQAALNAIAQDAQGHGQVSWHDSPWEPGGIVMALNPSPYLTGEDTAAELAWGPAARQAYHGGIPGLAGEYLDSIEGYATPPLNYRPDHLAVTTVPPTFDLESRRPVLHHGFEAYELARWMADDLHRQGHLTMANTLPYRFGCLCTCFDAMGCETNWQPKDTYQPVADPVMGLWRAYAGKRPYLLLQNTEHERFGPYVERYFARCLAYGIFPGMFSHNAFDHHYFQTPAWYNRDRALFKRYLPQVKQVAEEGWEPVTGARCDNPAIHLERFGPGRTKSIFVTVHNPTERPQAGTVRFEPGVLGCSPAPKAVSLKAYETVMWRVNG